ncbi:hypothetical protein IJ750_01845 [bacterium]|nr:hypothetical protein [bacterium]
MRVNQITLANYGGISKKSLVKNVKYEQNPTEQQSPAFRGDTGRFIGGTLGLIAGLATAAVFAAPAAVVAGVFTIAGSKWGHDQEEEIKESKNNKKNGK